MTPDELLMPPGTRLVHVGPPKTGTTALQGALHAVRDRLGEYGVTYASAGIRHAMLGFLAVFGLPELVGQDPPDIEMWHRVLAEANGAGDGRVIVSSEFFSDADDEPVRAVLDELDRSRMHIVVTARPVIRVLPSAWQQYVKNLLRVSYEDWLDAMFNKPPYIEPSPEFWRRYRYDRQLARWVGLVGRENVTVVAPAEGDRDLVPRTFESFLGLPAGLLVPVEGVTNRSLTHGEAELVRLLNAHFERRWTAESYARLVRHGVVRQLTKYPPEPDAARIVTPRWALEEAAEVDRAAAEAITASGVRVIGDLSDYGKVPADLAAAADQPPAAPVLSPKAAKRAVTGAIRASKAAEPKKATAEAPNDRSQLRPPASGSAVRQPSA